MKFKVGDIVRVVRKVESYDINGMGEGESGAVDGLMI